MEVYGIDKIKEKKPSKKGLKERTASAPKQLLRRGLDDGTERLRGQFRDASQQGQRDGYGGDQIEDAAWGGGRRAERGIEKLLKKKQSGRDRRPEAEPVPSADFPETESPSMASAPADPPKQGDRTEPVRIKTREVAAGHRESPQTAIRQRFQRPASPDSSAQVVSEKRPHLRTEPPAIKTRESVRQGVHAYGETALPDVESLVPDRSSPRSKIQEIRQIFRRRMAPSLRRRQEAASLQPLQPRPPQIPSPEKAVKGTSPRQQAPAVKTKEACLRQQAVTPAESPAQVRGQGGREFVREQGRKEAVRRTAARRSRAKNDSAIQTSYEKGALQGNGGSLQSSPPDIQAPTPPLQGRDIPSPASPRTEKSVTRAVKGAASKEKKAVKASRAGIKNSRQAVKAAARSAKAARKSAQAAAKAPQRAVKAARATAKAGAATAREAAKASVSAIKGAIAAAQELVAALAAGGWAVVAVVLVLCMVGLLIASPFGLFFSDAEGNGSGVPQAVAQLNGEFTARIEQIKEDTPHDVLDLDNDAVAAVLDNWRNVLAVYAVRASTDGSSPSGLDGLTPENLVLLREAFWDMNQISSFMETVPKGEDETETVLHITAVAKTPQEMAMEYGFTDNQKELLEELLKPEYQELFQTLIGSSQDLTLSIEQVQKILDSLPDDLSEERRQVVLTAYQLLGKVNYFWGGKSLVLGWDSRWGTPKEVWAAGSPSTGTVRPYGLDCSGFVDWVFYNISGGTYIIGHGGGAHMQHTYCDPISWDEAIPGDLVFYPEDTHVGIVCGFDSAGNVQIIHCASGANNVVVTGKSGFTAIARPKYYTS